MKQFSLEVFRCQVGEEVLVPFKVVAALWARVNPSFWSSNLAASRTVESDAAGVGLWR